MNADMGKAMGQAWPLLGMLALAKQMVPPEGKQLLRQVQRIVGAMLTPFCFYDIPEFDGASVNELYRATQLHLNSCKAFGKASRVTLCRPLNSKTLAVRLASDDSIVDHYKGMAVWWTHTVSRDRHNRHSGLGDERRQYILKIRKRDKVKLMPEYLDHIAASAAEYLGRNRDMNIYTNSNGHHFYSSNGTRRLWESVPYKHPSTFETLALDPFLKEKVMADLRAFKDDQMFYQRVGRAWKRGYLLFGPPGTGKSSMIAAMANYLKYDIYDLELTQVQTNTDLRQLLIQTTNKSIIVIEDIDCSLNLTGRRHARRGIVVDGEKVGMEEDDSSKITLSGLLNFTDGLWSCCGDERIIVFTTNHIEKLDAALLRPGRMDMHIEMSYCTFPAFKVLASNYLSIQYHPLLEKVELGLQEAHITPAEISEVLIQHRDDVNAALEHVLLAVVKHKGIPPLPLVASTEAVET